MKPKTMLKIATDIIMTVMLAIQMAFIHIGQETHEWAGIILFVLFIFHHVLNYRWLKNLFRGRYTPYRIILTLVNAMIFAAMAALIISGITMSGYAFAEAGFGLPMSLARKLHMVSSYGGYLLMSVHLGMHWAMLMKTGRIVLKERAGGRAAGYLKFIVSLVIAAYGVVSLLKHDILSYVFLTKEFVFFDFDQSLFSFMTDYAAILGLFVFAAHYIRKILMMIPKGKTSA